MCTVTDVLRYLLSTAFLVTSGFAHASQATSGHCSPSIGAMSGQASVNIQCSNAVSTVQEAYLIATHPTKLEVVDAKFTTWLEDHGAPFFSLEFKNSSELPAINVMIDVLQTGTSSRFDELKPFRVAKSNVLNRIGSLGVTVNAGTDITLPIVSAKDLAVVVQSGMPKDFCPYDAALVAGLTDEENQARMVEASNQMRSLLSRGESLPNSRETSQTFQRGILVRIRYSTIFQQKNTNYMFAFVYYARRDTQPSLWYPSRKQLAPLTCIGDDTYSAEGG